jgi:flagella basal body P-ring formation protein FlgA
MQSISSTFVILLAITASAGAAEIHLRAQCQCDQPLVTLADVAEIFPVDDAQAEQLATTELFPAPAAGRSRRCKAREIYDVLVQRGVDLKQHRLTGASTVEIFAPDVVSDAASAASKAGQSKLAATKNSAVAAPQTLPPEVIDAASEAKVIVAARSIARGHIVTPADVRLEEIDPQLASGTSPSLEQIIGQEAQRAIPAGQWLVAGDVRAPRLVHRGEIVTVFARTRGVQVRTTAKALDEGAQGDLVALESLLTKDARFTARVVARKEVEIMAGAPRVESAEAITPLPRAANRPVNRESMFELRVGDKP